MIRVFFFALVSNVNSTERDLPRDLRSHERACGLYGVNQRQTSRHLAASAIARTQPVPRMPRGSRSSNRSSPPGPANTSAIPLLTAAFEQDGPSRARTCASRREHLVAADLRTPEQLRGFVQVRSDDCARQDAQAIAQRGERRGVHQRARSDGRLGDRIHYGGNRRVRLEPSRDGLHVRGRTQHADAHRAHAPPRNRVEHRFEQAGIHGAQRVQTGRVLRAHGGDGGDDANLEGRRRRECPGRSPRCSTDARSRSTQRLGRSCSHPGGRTVPSRDERARVRFGVRGPRKGRYHRRHGDARATHLAD